LADYSDTSVILQEDTVRNIRAGCFSAPQGFARHCILGRN
jgi:hypothetical protein